MGKLRELSADDFVLEPLVVSFLTIVFNELRNRFSHGRFAKEDHVVQARFFDRSKETFGKSIKLGDRSWSFRDSTPTPLKNSRNW